MMGARIQLLHLLGILLLASVSVSFGTSIRNHQESEGNSYSEENPFYFSSDSSFLTLYKNQYGHIRVLERFDQRSKRLENLEDYRLVEFKSKPQTLLLPHHADADFLLVVLSGRAILTLVNPDGNDTFILEPGYAQKIPAGTVFYLINPDENENLRVIKLAKPVNNPHKFQNFFLSSTEAQQSYLQGFSRNILEASFDSEFKDINKALFGEEYGKSKQEGVIVELSKEQIRQLCKHTKPSSSKTISSEDEPFNLKSLKPIYSNKYGKLYEITPKKNPQLRDFNIFLSNTDISEGGLYLPHYYSTAIVVIVVNKGEAKVELVGPREQEQKQEEEQEESRKVQKFRADLSEDDVFVIPAAYPVAINATSKFNFFAFGINAENSERNFLAGEKDNVMSEIPKQVLEVTFPGSGENVEKLIKKQKESFFVDAQPQQEKGGYKGRKGPLSSILGTLH
ncbi:unnamed protein product [Sphenostylis stenocarpa]|uniref:Cupin type-1 domain-containing protein n=1 Tax=Sphenostylis stenocarpa TaxID=92480 RepID=A0AA86SVJ7_9FABA|nr:unnamed protein product [Sphenostylis stenocarpa]